MVSRHAFVGFGNPLLDMSIRDGEEVLKKYDLKANDAILAEEKHLSIYQHIVDNYDVTYVAGGASQNTSRCAQYILPANSTVYFGCVGDDDLAKQLRAANDREGLHSAYQVKPEVPTGSCAVVITGHDRSLCTNLGAAEKFDKSHLETPEIKEILDNGKLFYMEGYFLTHGLETALIVAKKAKETGALFAINLSAPFIPQFFSSQLDQILPYTAIVIGNESEAETYAGSHNLSSTDLPTVAKAIANFASELPSSIKRRVILTHGAEPSVLAVQGEEETRSFPVKPVENIVDTNGAGDAFAGGVLGALLLEQPIEKAIEAGNTLGGLCIGQNGPVLPHPKVQVL
ncbi:adenosine kinase [Tilletia horrida]|uniref:Adenosine kinase n=1 Tax=Tilletia horrida TaxID=155126 RepID=A0AAN6GIJ8_9BASI|nr:adenosine kinase [Tilletia horrida]KAK0537264.1 adenosine kinase [Tilletia horrida]KAK0539077.1 adenosine kinase [Tilletia horrida]